MKTFTQEIYSRPAIDRIKDQLSSALKQMEDAVNWEDQKSAIHDINQIKKAFDTSCEMACIRQSINTLDTFYDEEKRFFDQITPEIDDLMVQFYTLLSKSPFKKQLVDVYGEQLFAIAHYKVRSFDSKIIDDLKEENKATTSYSKLVAAASIDFDGKKRNLSELAPYTEHINRDVRKKAQEARFSFVDENAASFDTIYDQLVHIRHNMAQKMGYENYTSLGYAKLLRSDYDANDIALFREQIRKHVLPVVQKIRKKQAKRIGVDSLKSYDLPLFFREGNPTPKGNPDWIVSKGREMYQSLSPETAEFFQFMEKKELMDLVTKKGKDIGGYCTMLPDYGAPFIFSNFNGTSGDIDVLTHEAGHAFQIYNSRHLEINDYYWPTYEACEIHSMSMEFFTWPWMHLFFKEDAEKYKYMHLASALVFLPYGAAVDEFQHLIYSHPHWSPKERNQCWKEMEKKYLSGVDYDHCQSLSEGRRWQLQPHIYQTPFYYIDYVLAQICALQFWKKMNENYSAAWKKYVALCQKGGSLSFLDLLPVAGLNSPFEESTIKETIQHIDQWLDQIDDDSL